MLLFDEKAVCPPPSRPPMSLSGAEGLTTDVLHSGLRVKNGAREDREGGEDAKKALFVR
jgi:hypothetical protein